MEMEQQQQQHLHQLQQLLSFPPPPPPIDTIRPIESASQLEYYELLLRLYCNEKQFDANQELAHRLMKYVDDYYYKLILHINQSIKK